MHHLLAPTAAPSPVMSIPAWLPQWISRMDSADKMIVCERGDLVMVFNFHPTTSYTGYKVRQAGSKCQGGEPSANFLVVIVTRHMAQPGLAWL
ncbi:hypothetical protein V8C86DRAFT_2542837 [Haematococcus lacustris]